MSHIAIVAVGYNRPDSMATLLDSVGRIITDNCIDLIISIDKGKRQSEIIDVAERFVWKFGNKRIRAFDERQGLRKHILQCGDLTEEYDAVIVLEDDLVVSPFCVSYVEQAIDFYGNSPKIAGISLYKHLFHPGVSRPFEPCNNGYDAFLMQFAQSWGQCWTKRMWKEFRSWYTTNENINLSDGHILPDYISAWNEHSWLKYYMRYIVETDKYFVYPMVSLSSNGSDIGQHCSIPINDYQVPMLSGNLKYRFPQFENAVIYDVYFERKKIEDQIFPELEGKKMIDLYGGHVCFFDAKYLISTQVLPYKVLKTLAICYRPIEQNLITPTDGQGIFVYDLSISAATPKDNINILTRYDVRGVHWKRLIKLGLSGLKNAIMLRIRKE